MPDETRPIPMHELGAHAERAAAARAQAEGVHEQEAARARAILLVLVGLAFLAAGLYFLFNPSLPPADPTERLLGRDIVNVQRLAFGQTFSIVGAILVAAGARPRR